MKCFSVVLLACCLSTVCHAEPQPQLFVGKPQIKSWAWVDTPWKGSSTPFLQIKSQIDAAFKNPKQIEAVTQKYKEVALVRQNDAVAQYGWAYAACAGRPIGVRTRGAELADIAMALDNVPSPNATEYDRVRFIVTVRWVPYSQLKPLGKRLLQHDVNDYRVKRGVVDLLASGSSSEQKQALTYAQQLVSTYPKRSGSYSSLGWVYTMMFVDKKDRALGDKAIASYRKFLVLSNDPLARKGIQRDIDVIQQKQERLQVVARQGEME